MHAITFALLLAFVIQLIWSYFIYPEFISPLRLVPKLKADWRFRTYEWLYTEPNPRQIDRWLERTRHNGIVRYYGILGAPRILPLAPLAVKEVLVNKVYGGHFERSPLNRQRFGTLFGNGLFVLEGEAHSTQKKKLLPAFAPRKIKELHPVFWAKALELAETMGKFAKEHKSADGYSTVELVHFTSLAALDVIGVAAWGKDFEALKKPDSDFVTQYTKIFRGSPKANRQANIIYAAALAIPMKTLRRVFPCVFFDNLANGRRAIQTACREAIDGKKSSKSQREIPTEDRSHKDILNQAISADVFDDEQLSGHMMNLLAAGHETSSLAVTWSCYLLCKRLDVQKKLRNEIRSNIPSPSSGATDSNVLDELPYLRAVIKESLRILPPAPIVRREASSDTSILEQPVPKGTGVILSAWHVNRNREEWGLDAADFKPERWLSSQVGNEKEVRVKAVEDIVSSRFAYVPFMAGPRSCIGEEFAKAELAASLSVLIGKFDLKLKDGSFGNEKDVIWGITAKPRRLYFKVKELEGW